MPRGRAKPQQDDQAEAQNGNRALAGRSTKTESPRHPLRTRVLPRSVLGLASLILAFAIGAGFSGTILFSYYQYRLDQTDAKVNALVNGYKSQFAKAQADLAAAAAQAKSALAAQVKSLTQTQTSPATVAAVVKLTAPSVFFVHTLSSSGAPSVGSAFVVSSDPDQSLLLTSYTTVAAATVSPGPQVFVQQGNQELQATLRSWDPTYDLALLSIPKGDLHPLAVAPTSPAPLPGEDLYVVSGLGNAGASVSVGTVVDVSAQGLAVAGAIGPAFQGGPVVDGQGRVLAVASRSYSPLGFASSGVWYLPYVQAACNKVLTCPSRVLP